MMSFGSKNSRAMFQRMMGNVLANASNLKCYVDDVVVHSASIEKHIKHLENIMSLLRNHKLRVQLRKYFFMQLRVELLGHVMNKQELQKTREAEPPRDANEL